MSKTKHHYIKLSEEEISDPHLAIFRFFDYSHIETIRENLWEWLKITVSGTFSTHLLSKGRPYDLIYLYEHIEKLIEAAHIINTQQSKLKKDAPRRQNEIE